MLTESSENESSNSDPNYAIRKNDSSAEFVASLEKLCLENINRLIFGHLNIVYQKQTWIVNKCNSGKT